ncbi:MAG: winged helix-turn-helix domain-containing protein [Candidatus Thorarchaeota archaeon]|jgi:DNA-binding transcriptional ArsR family regulator
MQESSSYDETSEGIRYVLYSFWDSIPRIEFVNVSKEILESHPARKAILRILREGILEETVPPSDDHRIRRAINADEIREMLEKSKMTKVSKTGMYFHLKVLEEAGLIKVVSRILEGRHRVAYYGRVARHLFISDPEMRLQKYESLFSAVTKYAKARTPRSRVAHFRNIPKKYLKIKIERERMIGEWLVDNEDIITKLGLDLNELFDAVKLIDSSNPVYLDLFSDLFELLQIGTTD